MSSEQPSPAAQRFEKTVQVMQYLQRMAELADHLTQASKTAVRLWPDECDELVRIVRADKQTIDASPPNTAAAFAVLSGSLLRVARELASIIERGRPPELPEGCP